MRAKNKIIAVGFLFAIVFTSCEKDSEDPLERLKNKINEGIKDIFAPPAASQSPTPVPSVPESSMVKELNLSPDAVLVSTFFEKLDHSFELACGDEECTKEKIANFCAAFTRQETVALTSLDGANLGQINLFVMQGAVVDKQSQEITLGKVKIAMRGGLSPEEVILPDDNLIINNRRFAVTSGIGWRGTIKITEEKVEVEQTRPPVELNIEGFFYDLNNKPVHMKLSAEAELMEKEEFVHGLFCFLNSGNDKPE